MHAIRQPFFFFFYAMYVLLISITTILMGVGGNLDNFFSDVFFKIWVWIFDLFARSTISSHFQICGKDNAGIWTPGHLFFFVNSFVRIRTYGMMGSVNIFEKKEKRKLEMAGKEKKKKQESQEMAISSWQLWNIKIMNVPDSSARPIRVHKSWYKKRKEKRGKKGKKRKRIKKSKSPPDKSKGNLRSRKRQDDFPVCLLINYSCSFL